MTTLLPGSQVLVIRVLASSPAFQDGAFLEDGHHGVPWETQDLLLNLREETRQLQDDNLVLHAEMHEADLGRGASWLVVVGEIVARASDFAGLVQLATLVAGWYRQLKERFASAEGTEDADPRINASGALLYAIGRLHERHGSAFRTDIRVVRVLRDYDLRDAGRDDPLQETGQFIFAIPNLATKETIVVVTDDRLSSWHEMTVPGLPQLVASALRTDAAEQGEGGSDDE